MTVPQTPISFTRLFSPTLLCHTIPCFHSGKLCILALATFLLHLILLYFTLGGCLWIYDCLIDKLKSDLIAKKKTFLFWTSPVTHLNYALFLSFTSYFCDLLSDLIIDVMILGDSNAFLNKIKYLMAEAFDLICIKHRFSWLSDYILITYCKSYKIHVPISLPLFVSSLTNW